MVSRCWNKVSGIFVVVGLATVTLAEPMGSVRGVVYDKDFDAPLPLAQVKIVETDETVKATEEGNYVFSQVPPGTYTLVFSKGGYTRQVKTDVVVSAGQMTDVISHLSGEFEEMEEFIVQDLSIGGTEAALLELRMKSPALMDSISSELMSQAGASDAASALKLVSGTTVQEGKFAVIRGLPDRYVNSQMNGVRLPTADIDKRAVELDQFPSAVIESIQVSKTFTPDQQGDASGGAVNIVLKGVPDKTTLKLKIGSSVNNQVGYNNTFLTSTSGGPRFWGKEDRDIPVDGIFDGDLGARRGQAPIDYNWALSGGTKYDFDTGLRIGGFGSFNYKHDSSYHDNGIEDNLWVDTPGEGLIPKSSQGSPSGSDPEEASFYTSLYDITQGKEEVKWSALGVVGMEMEDHRVSATYMYTRVADNTVTLAEDTRGKRYYFVNYNLTHPYHPGNQNFQTAPYHRTETVKYTERTTETLQFHGKHPIPIPEVSIEDIVTIMPPEIDWTLAYSSASMYQPDKSQFGSSWTPHAIIPNPRWWKPPTVRMPKHGSFKPEASFTIGNLQRIWKNIEEESDQYFINMKFPFRQWSDDEGYVKVGIFNDKVFRVYNQDSFSNLNDNAIGYFGPWNELWSRSFLQETHPISAADIDVDYEGEQKISAIYYMVDIPVCSFLNLIGGVRYESTELMIKNDPEPDVRIYDRADNRMRDMLQGEADVDFMQEDVLPSLGFILKPIDELSFRGSYSRTVARQTFKELTPIQQQEFLGGDIFIGNPELQMSALHNYDLRLDYRPYKGGLLSASWFTKKVEKPIEYVQRIADYTFTTPVNYTQGTISGYEFEIRQELGFFAEELQGLAIGANATILQSEVELPIEESIPFEDDAIRAPTWKRDMTNCPEYLYNIYLTYELKEHGTKAGLFYNVQGDTLVVGAGVSGNNYVPDIYQLAYGTLNFTLSQMLDENWKLTFKAKNITNPEIIKVYRSKYIGDDVQYTSYTKGSEFSVSLSATW